MPIEVLKLDPANPAPVLERAASVLRAGGLVIYPTESFYALGADALSAASVDRVYAAKGRPGEKPLPVIIHDKSLIGKYAVKLSARAEAAVRLLMPGPVTLVLWASDAFPKNLTAWSGKAGIRVPEHAVASGLAAAFGGPVTATSANLSGLPGMTDPAELAEVFRDTAELLIDVGEAPGPPPSTLLDMTVEPPAILRPGRMPVEALEAVVGPLPA
ncbi:MAG: threonylcarbamoyl-AMP synthase [Nitrospirae bacterium]|nr:threonylcarbamoyl-AMP synthase [Nitrospirota bacterium]MBI5695451.1 threonylcarbamoyl-AMP synthase [Nitrospirota bacterium]